MFQVGDKIFYPMHGAGIVEAIEEKEVLGEKNLYYIINIPHINTQIMIPIKTARKLGVREVVEPDIIDQIIGAFLEGDTDPNIYDNQRYCIDLNRKRIKSGDIYEGAEVIRDLMRKGLKVKLGTEDVKMLSNARQIFVSELIQVKGIDQEQAVELLDDILTLPPEDTCQGAR
jgi:CarD family transcriptional regulator